MAEKTKSGTLCTEMSDDEHFRRLNLMKLVKKLESYRGNGTSMISIMIPPGFGQMARMRKLLTDEHGTASCIKSKTNRLSVLSAITSIQQKLSLYNGKVPENGLILYCGCVLNEDGKEKKVNIDIEPPQIIKHSLYICGSRFDVAPLKTMLDDDQCFGFIIMDGHGCLFGTVRGNARQVLHKFEVALPSKHGRGGQSQARFSRNRDEHRHNYVRKVAEQAEHVFLSPGSEKKPKIHGLILAGSADFKNVLHSSPMLNSKLQSLVLQVVDVSYGRMSGFNEAIQLSSAILANLRFVTERRHLMMFFEKLARDPDLCCVGVSDCMSILQSGVISTLIVSESLNIQRYRLRNHITEVDRTLFLNPQESLDKSHFFDETLSVELELVEKDDLVDWLMQHYKEFGFQLETVSDSSSEGYQFMHGLGGMGAFLRYQIDIPLQFEVSSDESDFEND